MLKLPAELTHAQADACLSQWLSQLPVGQGPVVVDGGGLRQFDSTALALLLELRRHLLGRGQMLVLESVPLRLRELAVLYGVDALLAT